MRLEDLLVQHATRVLSFVRNHANTLLAYESIEDLVQGAHMRVIQQRDNFHYRSEPEFFSWLFTIVRSHLADRHEYWSALKRRSGRVLRFTMSQGSDGAVPVPASTKTGPGTFAERRELLALAARALAALPDRDQQLLQWNAERLPLAQQAEHLSISYAAVQQAGLRAQQRFHKTFELLMRR